MIDNGHDGRRTKNKSNTHTFTSLYISISSGSVCFLSGGLVLYVVRYHILPYHIFSRIERLCPDES
jgi:hypothetical protein